MVQEASSQSSLSQRGSRALWVTVKMLGDRKGRLFFVGRHGNWVNLERALSFVEMRSRTASVCFYNSARLNGMSAK